MSNLWRAVVVHRKVGRLRYLGHLDLCRAIERALRRAALPVAYTQGFHERMRIAHGPALPVGGEGLAEIFSATLTEPLSDDELARRLVAQFPDDLGLVAARVEPDSAPLVLKSLRRGAYDVTIAANPPITSADLASVIAQALASDRLEVASSDPDKPPVDVRPRIHGLALSSDAPLSLAMSLSIASDSYLSPERCLQALARFLRRPASLRWLRLVRTGMFVE